MFCSPSTSVFILDTSLPPSFTFARTPAGLLLTCESNFTAAVDRADREHGAAPRNRPLSPAATGTHAVPARARRPVTPRPLPAGLSQFQRIRRCDARPDVRGSVRLLPHL